MHGNSKMRAARELDTRLRELTRQSRQVEAEIALALLKLSESNLYRMLGFPRIADYAKARLEMPGGKARALVELARKLGDLPELDRVFRAGELSWTKCRQIARAASRETELEWIEKARIQTNRELEHDVARAKGEEPKVRLVLELTVDESTDIEDAVARLRTAHGVHVGFGSAVAELVRLATRPTVDRPRHQVVIHECAKCATASRDAADGPVPVTPAKLAEVKEDAEVLDLRHGGVGTRGVTIPPAVRRAVIARDHCRCVICHARAHLHIHHIDRLATGGSSHDAANLTLVCSVCHAKLVHGRFVKLDGRADALELVLVDGTRVPVGSGRPSALRALASAAPPPVAPRVPIPTFLRVHMRETLLEVGDDELLRALEERGGVVPASDRVPDAGMRRLPSL